MGAHSALRDAESLSVQVRRRAASCRVGGRKGSGQGEGKTSVLGKRTAEGTADMAKLLIYEVLSIGKSNGTLAPTVRWILMDLGLIPKADNKQMLSPLCMEEAMERKTETLRRRQR